ncbi:MAG TPA: methionyl-tRNA formyltransferase [Verrucomicrobiales bacterium]|nr:methionyl-tRNA formyltransferase [Verrucomicrobiales bacterium]
MDRLRVIFMGSAELACNSLQALRADRRTEMLAVVTQPDKPKGRALKLSPTPVGALAESLGLPLHKPKRARDPEFIETLRELRPDLIVVVAYGQLLPQSLLDVPRHGCLNVHTSLLPKYRGAAPIQWAIVDGEPETGVTIMQMDAGLDTGPILSQARTPITADDTAAALHDRLATIGARLLIDTIPGYVSGELKPCPQPAEGVSVARKISKEDGRIDWSRPARAIFNQIRGFDPWPGAFTTLPLGGQPRLLKLWRARVFENTSGTPGNVITAGADGVQIGCGSGALLVTELQLEGGRRMPVRDFLIGHPLAVGTAFGQP